MPDPASLLESLLATSPDGVLAFDRECRYTVWNRQMERISGYDAEVVLGRCAFEVFPFLKETGEDHYFLEALAGRTAVAVDRPYTIPETGHQGFFEGRYAPLRDAEGQVVGGMAVIRDITVQKEVERGRAALAAAEERQRVLAEASQVLGASLDYETTLQQVARLALPRLADMCLVDLIEEGKIRRIAVAHVDPEQEGLLRELQERFPPTWDSPIPAARVIRGGIPELLAEVDEGVVASHTLEPEHADLIRKVGMRSHLAVPLVARGETLGAISLARTRSDTPYGPGDQTLVEELARRAAVAIDNARLYRAAQLEIEERRRVEDTLRLHSQVLESMQEGVSVADAGGLIIYTNFAEDAMFGYGPGELVGRHVAMLNAYPPAENARIVDEVFQTLKRDGLWIGEWRNRKKDGTPFTTRAQITGLEMAGKQYWVCVQEDITKQKAAQEALQASASRLSLAFEAGRLGDWEWQAATDLVAFSERAAAIFGIPPGPHMTWTAMRELLHPDDRERARLAVDKSIAEHSDYDIEYRVNRPDGRECWVAARGRAVYDPAGTVLKMLGVVQDITARKRAEEALIEETRTVETINRIGQVLAAELDLHKLLQALTDAATEISDAQFGSFFYNVVDERGEAYMLYTLSGVPREKFAQFPMPRNTAVFAPTFRGEGIVRLDDVTRDPRHGKNPPYNGMPEGHLPVRSYLAVPVVSRTGEVLGGLFFGHAEVGVFTERHERVLTGIAAQAAIAVDNARLYKQARDAEYAARERAEELTAASRQKDDFLAMLAHELRNPLGAISNSIHVMGLSSPDRPAFKRAHEVAVRQIAHQTRLVDDLLDVSRIARGKILLTLERLDLGLLVRDAVEDHRGACENAGVSLVLEVPDEPVYVQGDRVRLAQVLGNLLDNARKFTPAGGRISVRLALGQSGEAVLTVHDTGIGIEPAVLPNLFTPFAQADRSLDRSQGGLGLGLALVKGLVELHAGGSVRVTSAGVNHGAEFSITLPVEAGALPGREGIPAAAPASASLRVLVIEDIRDAADTLRDLLELFGCQVEIAYSGAEGLAKARDFLPDVVLCDIGLPGGLTGYEVAAELRKQPETAHARLIAVTGYGAPEDQRRAFEAGFDLHLTKPFQPEHLQQAVVANPHARPSTYRASE